jgi:hypothetical protein
MGGASLGGGEKGGPRYDSVDAVELLAAEVIACISRVN